MASQHQSAQLLDTDLRAEKGSSILAFAVYLKTSASYLERATYTVRKGMSRGTILNIFLF